MALSTSNVVPPAQAALNTKKTDPFNPFPVKQPTPTNFNSLAPLNQSTPTGPIHAAPPSLPIKNQTITNADGSSHTTTYDTSGGLTGGGATSGTKVGNTQTVASTQQPTFSASGGAVIPTGGAAGTPQAQPTDTQQQNPQQNQQYSASNPPTYPGLVSGLANFNPFNNEQVSGAYQNAQGAQAELQNLKNEEADKTATAGQQAMPIGELLGRQGLIHNLYAQKEAAAASALQGYGSIYQGGFAGTGQQEGALSAATGAAAPQLASYSQQPFNPLTSQFGAGGGTLNDAVSTVAQRVQSGQMSYDQAASALSGYGQGGINALQQALGPNFNVAQSNALSGVQGAVGPAVEYANSALDLLSNAAGKLTTLGQGSNIPLLNAAGTAISSATGYGGDQTQAYKSAVAEARAALTNVFIQKGVTPTAAGDQANALIPDNPTPQQIAAAKQTLATFGQSTQSIYGNPGAANSNSNAQSTTNPPGWF